MILWRISAYSDLSGTGGERVSGRWHLAGRPVVYTAASPAGAMLEIMVHLEIDREDLPETMQLLRIELPEGASQAPVPSLPEGWQSDTGQTRTVGNSFLDGCGALLLPVPSAIMPFTNNFLFNPRHPDALKATVTLVQFKPDPRLF